MKSKKTIIEKFNKLSFPNKFSIIVGCLASLGVIINWADSIIVHFTKENDYQVDYNKRQIETVLKLVNDLKKNHIYVKALLKNRYSFTSHWEKEEGDNFYESNVGEVDFFQMSEYRLFSYLQPKKIKILFKADGTPDVEFDSVNLGGTKLYSYKIRTPIDSTLPSSLLIGELCLNKNIFDSTIYSYITSPYLPKNIRDQLLWFNNLRKDFPSVNKVLNRNKGEIIIIGNNKDLMNKNYKPMSPIESAYIKNITSEKNLMYADFLDRIRIMKATISEFAYQKGIEITF